MRTRRLSIFTGEKGFLLVEAATAAFLTAALMTLAVGALALISRADKTSHQRQLAAHEAANVMERLATLDGGKLSEVNVSDWNLSQAASDELPGGRLVVHVAKTKATLLRKVSVEVDWKDSAGRRIAPVRLTAWINSQRRSSQ